MRVRSTRVRRARRSTLLGSLLAVLALLGAVLVVGGASSASAAVPRAAAAPAAVPQVAAAPAAVPAAAPIPVALRYCPCDDQGPNYWPCEVDASKVSIKRDAFYISGSAKSRCWDDDSPSGKIRRQWVHAVLQRCTPIDGWPDKCLDWGLDGAEDASRAQKPPRWAHVSLRASCGHHGGRHWWRLRAVQTVEMVSGAKVTFRHTSGGSGIKKCGAQVSRARVSATR